MVFNLEDIIRYSPILALTICVLANSAIAAPAGDDAKKIAVIKKLFVSDNTYTNEDIIKQYATPELKKLITQIDKNELKWHPDTEQYRFWESFVDSSDPSPLDPKSVKYTVLKNGNVQVIYRTLPIYDESAGKKSKVVAVKPYTAPTVHYKVVCSKSCLIDDIILPSGDPRYPDDSYKQAMKHDLSGKRY